MSRLARVAGALLPSDRTGRALALSAGIDSLGTGVFFASATLYFVGVVGLPAAKVALATTLAGALALLAPVPLGRLADRWGPGRFALGMLVARAAGYAAFALVDSYVPYLVLTVVMTALDRSYTPIQQTVVTAVLGEQGRTRAMASIRAVRNIGLTAGFLLAGVVFATRSGGAWLVVSLGNGVTFLAAAALVRYALRRTGAQPRRAVKTKPQVASPLRRPWFLLFTLGNGVLSLYDTVLIVLLPVWILQETRVPPAWVPVLMAVNTVLTVVLQVYVARFAEGFAASVRLLALTGLLMCATCGFFALAQTAGGALALQVGAVVAGVLALSAAENLHSVAAWELSALLAPAEARARYLGAFSLALTGQKVAGPTLLVVLLLPAGLPGWAALAGAFGAATALCRTSARRSLAERDRGAAAAAPVPPAGPLPS